LNSNNFKFGTTFFWLLLFVTGCTNGDGLTYEGANYFNQDIEAGFEEYVGFVEYVTVVLVDEIFEENGKLKARLEPLVREPTRMFYLETPCYIVVEDDNEKENVWPPGPIDNSILWFEVENGLVEIEEDYSQIISDATISDIMEGDILRLYLRQTVVYVGGGMGNGGNTIDKIVIVR